VELWASERCKLHVEVSLGTLQLDLSKDIEVYYAKTEHLGQVVQAGMRGLRVNFGDAPHQALETGVHVLAEQHPGANLEDLTTQFITRVVKGEVLTEEIIRCGAGASMPLPMALPFVPQRWRHYRPPPFRKKVLIVAPPPPSPSPPFPPRYHMPYPLYL